MNLRQYLIIKNAAYQTSTGQIYDSELAWRTNEYNKLMDNYTALSQKYPQLAERVAARRLPEFGAAVMGDYSPEVRANLKMLNDYNALQNRYSELNTEIYNAEHGHATPASKPAGKVPVTQRPGFKVRGLRTAGRVPAVRFH